MFFLSRRCIFVCGRNERVLRSFLGLASQAIYPTGAQKAAVSWGYPGGHLSGCIRWVAWYILVGGLGYRMLMLMVDVTTDVFSGPNGEDMEDWPSVLVPPGLTLKMLSTVPVAFGSTGPSTIQQSLDAFGLQFNWFVLWFLPHFDRVWPSVDLHLIFTCFRLVFPFLTPLKKVQ